MQRTHGPWISKHYRPLDGGGERVELVMQSGEKKRTVPLANVADGRCPCALCEERGQSGLPGEYSFVRERAGGPMWICAGGVET